MTSGSLRRRRGLCVLAAVVLVLVSSAGVGPGAGPSSKIVPSAAADPTVVPWAAPATVSQPRAAPLSIPVGEGPDALVVDSPNGTLFVANQYTNNVSEVSLSSGTFLGAIPVGSGPCPGCMALDVQNGTVYVANSGSNNVSAISVAYGGISATIPVGITPDAILYNAGNHNVYVADAGSGDVTVISSLTNNRTLTIPVGPDPVALALDTTHHNVLVAVSGSNNLTILSGISNTPLAVVTVGSHPDAIAYDPGNNEIYVANGGSDNVSVIGALNHTLDATISVGSGPSALVVNPAKGEVLVANRFSNNVSVISTALQTVVANLTVGAQPGTDGAMAFLPKTGAVFVADSGSNNVSILTATPPSVAGNVPVLNIPEAIALNTSSGLVYVANFGSANVSVFSVARVTFRAGGLPAGSNWTVGAGTPTVVRTNTTFRASGTLTFFEPNGSLSFTITPPSGYGVARVAGPRGTTQTSTNLSSLSVVLRVVFGPLEPLYVNETGLPSGASWGVTISSGFAHGGAPSQNGSSSGPSILFTVVKGPWKYSIDARPSTYRPALPHGAIHVGPRPAQATVRFLLVGERIVFTEAGLPSGTLWGVNISGPQNVSLNGTTGSLSVLLGNGSYTFVVWNFSTLHPNAGGTPHDAGTFTVVAPGLAQQLRISYGSTP